MVFWEKKCKETHNISDLRARKMNEKSKWQQMNKKNHQMKAVVWEKQSGSVGSWTKDEGWNDSKQKD